MIVTPFTHDPTHKTVWDVHMNGNVFPGLTVWGVQYTNRNVFLGLTVCDIHTNGNVLWDSLCEMYIRTETIGFRCLARSQASQLVCQEGLSPSDSASCWKDRPIIDTHLATVPNVVAERGFKPFV